MISIFSRKVALAIGESLESVCSMQEKERKELMEVLGFKVMSWTFLGKNRCVVISPSTPSCS